jgi:hypothetical protein
MAHPFGTQLQQILIRRERRNDVGQERRGAVSIEPRRIGSVNLSRFHDLRGLIGR